MTPAQNTRTAARMRAYREKRKVSLRKVAKAMGISAPYLCDLEKGRRGWSRELITNFVCETHNLDIGRNSQ